LVFVLPEANVLLNKIPKVSGYDVLSFIFFLKIQKFFAFNRRPSVLPTITIVNKAAFTSYNMALHSSTDNYKVFSTVVQLPKRLTKPNRVLNLSNYVFSEVFIKKYFVNYFLRAQKLRLPKLISEHPYLPKFFKRKKFSMKNYRKIFKLL
jgi:hypothetical protein